MRKNQLLSVFTLFLLVPASITWAQKISVKGNVYENNLVKTSVSTIHGEVVVSLPDDISAGESVQGSFELLPVGNTAKEIAKNLSELKHFSIRFGDKTIPLNTASFSCLVPPGNNMSSPVDLLNERGIKIAKSQVPLLNMSGSKMMNNSLGIPSTDLELDKKVFISGEYAAEYNLPSQPVNFYFSQQGKETVMNTVAASSRKEIIRLPQNVNGPAQIICKDPSGKTITTQDIHVLNLSASCPKNNLMKGEQTVLTVNIEGLSGIPADFVKLTLENTSANNVKLGSNNYEELILQTKGNNIPTTINPVTGVATVQRSVTALSSGPFIINLQLSYPSSVYNDPLKQQLDVIQNVNDLKAWQAAFLNDIGNTNISMELRTSSGPQTDWSKMLVHDLRADPNWKDLTPDYRYDSMERKIKKTGDTWKSPVAPQDLEQEKAFTYNIAQSFHIPKEVVENYFSCTLAAGNIALQNAQQAAVAGKVSFDESVVNTALKFVQYNAGVLQEDVFQQSATALLNDKMLSMQREIFNITQYQQAVQNIQNVTHEAGRALIQNMRTSKASNTTAPDPVKDLAGFFDPLQKKLYTTEADKQMVMALFNAKVVAGGQYIFQLPGRDMKPVSYTVSLVLATPQKLFDAAEEAKKKVSDLLREIARQTTLRNDVSPGKEKEKNVSPDVAALYDFFAFPGAPMRFVEKNRMCTLAREAHTGPCLMINGPMFITDSTNTLVFNPAVKYVQYEFAERWECNTGNGTCVSAYTCQSKKKTYGYLLSQFCNGVPESEEIIVELTCEK
jgi:hypothetical protein